MQNVACKAPPKFTTEQIQGYVRNEIDALRANPSELEHTTRIKGFLSLVERLLPEPPKPNIVIEVARAGLAEYTDGCSSFESVSDVERTRWESVAREMVARYLEVKKLPADPELEGK